VVEQPLMPTDAQMVTCRPTQDQARCVQSPGVPGHLTRIANPGGRNSGPRRRRCGRPEDSWGTTLTSPSWWPRTSPPRPTSVGSSSAAARRHGEHGEQGAGDPGRPDQRPVRSRASRQGAGRTWSTAPGRPPGSGNHPVAAFGPAPGGHSRLYCG
jgi:hypothetical protein